jgi:hypothetical protein
MFMVHFVRPANGFRVSVIGRSQPFEPLVNENIMNQKVRPAINKNA